MTIDHPETSTPTASGADTEASVRTAGIRSGSAAALTALFLIGSAAPVAALLHHTPLLTGQGLRYALASITLLTFLTMTGRLRTIRPHRQDLVGIALLGLVGIAGFTASFVSAARYADPALVGSILAATPVLLAILGPALLRRRPAAGVIAGAVIITAGTALATGTGSTSLPGLLLSLTALGCEVGFTLLALPLIARYGSLATTTLAVISGAVLLLLAGVIIEGPHSIVAALTPTRELLVLIFMALGVSVCANLAWYAALPRLGADRAGLFYAFTPIGALTAGLVLRTSSPDAGELIGLAVVLVGLVVGLIRPRVQGPM